MSDARVSPTFYMDRARKHRAYEFVICNKHNTRDLWDELQHFLSVQYPDLMGWFAHGMYDKVQLGTVIFVSVDSAEIALMLRMKYRVLTEHEYNTKGLHLRLHHIRDSLSR